MEEFVGKPLLSIVIVVGDFRKRIPKTLLLANIEIQERVWANLSVEVVGLAAWEYVSIKMMLGSVRLEIRQLFYRL